MGMSGGKPVNVNWLLPQGGKEMVAGIRCRRLGASWKMWIRVGIICFKCKREAFCSTQISSVEIFLFFKMTEFGYEQDFVDFNTVPLF